MSSLGQYATPKSYLDAQYSFETDEGTSEILASALVNRRTYYAACRQRNHETGKAETFALVCLVKYNPRDREGLVFGYKDMSETMGPCEAECPAKILDLLGSTTSANALDWRARCHAALARQGRTAPKNGDTIIFPKRLDLLTGQRRVASSSRRRVEKCSSPTQSQEGAAASHGGSTGNGPVCQRLVLDAQRNNMTQKFESATARLAQFRSFGGHCYRPKTCRSLTLRNKPSGSRFPAWQWAACPRLSAPTRSEPKHWPTGAEPEHRSIQSAPQNPLLRPCRSLRPATKAL